MACVSRTCNVAVEEGSTGAGAVKDAVDVGVRVAVLMGAAD